RPPDASSRIRSYELRCNRSRMLQTADLAQLLDAFENHAKLQIAQRAESRLFVHAGAVSWRGRGIVIPGRSGCGKTTLVRALGEAGALSYSDEFAVLDSDGRLHPYAIPLSIRGNGTPACRLSIEAVGGRAATTSVEVALVAVTRYRRYARWRPHPLSP